MVCNMKFVEVIDDWGGIVLGCNVMYWGGLN